MGSKRSYRKVSEQIESAWIEHLVKVWGEGNLEAGEEVFNLTATSLTQMAKSCLRSCRILTPDELVSELYIRLAKQSLIKWNGMDHFFGICNHLMIELIIDHIRHQRCVKCGGRVQFVQFDESITQSYDQDITEIAVRELLSRLRKTDPEHYLLIRLNHFEGLTIAETAKVVGISSGTVRRKLRYIHSEMRRDLECRAA